MSLTARQIFALTAAIVGIGAAAVNRDPEDKITLTSSTALKDVTLVLAGRRSDHGCSLDVVEAGPATEVGNLLTPGACRSELAVFASGHAATLRDHPPWSDKQGDEVDLTLAPRVVVPVKVWVAVSGPGSVALVRSDLTEAENLFEKNRGGVTFQPDIAQVAGSDVATIGFGCDNALDVVRSTPPVYDPNRLNVYYVEKIVDSFLGTPFRGFYCLDDRGIRNILYVSITLHSSTTLTHELGHAFVGLGHTGGPGVPRIPGFTSKNLMWSSASKKSSEARNAFSLGQVYRINADAESWLNQVVGGGGTALRPSGFTRPCHTTPDVCPPVALKWTPTYP
jgi:hypothetical protein